MANLLLLESGESLLLEDEFEILLENQPFLVEMSPAVLNLAGQEPVVTPAPLAQSFFVGALELTPAAPTLSPGAVARDLAAAALLLVAEDPDLEIADIILPALSAELLLGAQGMGLSVWESFVHRRTYAKSAVRAYHRDNRRTYTGGS